MTHVLDTNVILVANRQHPDVSAACVAACAKRLHGVMKSGRVALDDGYRILKEYQHKTQPQTGKHPGDVFVKWLLRNNANPARCDLVPLTEHEERGFASFPEDERLRRFDPPDRKFVAVAAAHPGRPPILQASDSKWLDWSPALKDHGVEVEFLCCADIEAFDAKKKGRTREVG